MKKFIIISMLLCIATIGRTYANDCSILVDEEKKMTIDENIEAIIASYKPEYENVLPKEAFKKALINLKSYCCTREIKKSCSTGDMDKIQPHYPASVFLFDHLLDVAMRRLDGITGLAYNINPDPTGIQRRTEITEIANSVNGTPANTIEEIYIKYWTGHINTTKNLTTIINAYKDNNIATLSLGDKYTTICKVVENIYNRIANKNKTIIGANLLNGCKNTVKERIERETKYIRILMIQKSNQLFTEATKAYTKKYFVEEKLMALWSLIAKVKDAFKTIVQQAPASKTCSL